MSGSSTPYGLMPINDYVGFPPRTQVIKNGIASGLASNIFKGQPVKLVTATGTITPVTATADKIYGVFAGVEYTPTGQRPVVSDFWPASSTYTAGLDRMDVYIWQSTLTQRYRIQADGSVAATLLGQQFNLSNFANGSTVTGLSACTAAAAGAGSGNQGQLTLLEFYEDVSDAAGDAFTDLIVAIAYPQSLGGFQVSP